MISPCDIRTSPRARDRRFASVAALAIVCAVSGMTAPAGAQTTPQSSSSAQPVLPQTKPGSPVVEGLVGQSQPPLEVRKHASRQSTHHAIRHARRHPAPLDLERPALAGVELLQPLPRPGQPPHITVPLPAYALDEVVTPFLTPPPPVVCHPVRREADLPDPRLYREVTVACQPDNP